jgi:hypothetical protein
MHGFGSASCDHETTGAGLDLTSLKQPLKPGFAGLQ